VGPHSFVDFRQKYDELSPPPKELTKEELFKPLSKNKEEIF